MTNTERHDASWAGIFLRPSVRGPFALALLGLLAAACTGPTLTPPPSAAPSLSTAFVARVVACVPHAPASFPPYQVPGDEADIALRFSPGSPLAPYGPPVKVFAYTVVGRATSVSDLHSSWGAADPAESVRSPGASPPPVPPLASGSNFALYRYRGSSVPDAATVQGFGLVLARSASISAPSLAALAGRSVATPFGRLYLESVGTSGGSVSVTLAVVPHLPSGYDVAGMPQATLLGAGPPVSVRRPLPSGWMEGPNGDLLPQPRHWETYVFAVRQRPSGAVTIRVDQWGISVPGTVRVTGLSKVCKAKS